jgi:hypothetical protein
VLALRERVPALRLVLVGATEGWLVAREIAAAGVPVITEPLTDLPARFEELGVDPVERRADGRCRGQGGDRRFRASNQPRYAPQQAGNLVALNKLPGATGLTWGEAFAAISSVPPRSPGSAGRPACSGTARSATWCCGTAIRSKSARRRCRVFIDGVEQPLDNHQTRLRERYRTPSEGTCRRPTSASMRVIARRFGRMPCR